MIMCTYNYVKLYKIMFNLNPILPNKINITINKLPIPGSTPEYTRLVRMHTERYNRPIYNDIPSLRTTSNW